MRNYSKGIRQTVKHAVGEREKNICISFKWLLPDVVLFTVLSFKWLLPDIVLSKVLSYVDLLPLQICEYYIS